MSAVTVGDGVWARVAAEWGRASIIIGCRTSKTSSSGKRVPMRIIRVRVAPRCSATERKVTISFTGKEALLRDCEPIHEPKPAAIQAIEIWVKYLRGVGGHRAQPQVQLGASCRDP